MQAMHASVTHQYVPRMKIAVKPDSLFGGWYLHRPPPKVSQPAQLQTHQALFNFKGTASRIPPPAPG